MCTSSCLQVFFFELAVDGVNMREKKVHSTQIFLIRGTAIPPAFRSRQRNVQPWLVIPGPQAPKCFDGYLHLLFMQLMQCLPPNGEALLNAKSLACIVYAIAGS